MADATNQVESRRIATALEIEKLELDLFRSRSLMVPSGGRGVYGGQVIAQALLSATDCVDPALRLHSLHCYFLTSASPTTPIVYTVERLRDGRSYSTRAVKAIQNGNTVFTLLCSFQRPEPWQPSHQWPVPHNVPPPDDCVFAETRFREMAAEPGISKGLKQLYLGYAEERTKSPILMKEAAIRDEGTVTATYMYWMKARDIPKYDASYQKCILAYLSDLQFIGTARRVLGLKAYGKGPDSVSMVSTIDHSIYFYNDEFDCGDWLLYVMMCPRTASGRGVVHGRLYTTSGTLVAITTQEGVVRANVRAPDQKDAKL